MIGMAVMRSLGLAFLTIVGASALLSASSPDAGPVSFPLLIEATLEDLRAGLDTGRFTSVDLVNAYTARILEVNDTLKAVTEINPDAIAIAAQADAQRASGEAAGPLHGIPLLLKNNIATRDAMSNTAGSYALLGATVPEDSTVAAKLRKVGAVLLGKTNLSQWANWRSSNSSNGWSAYGGQTEGAYYPGQDPSGSSSGSGVASSLGLALAALGTETDGSIVSPSNSNNLVGIKPTVGLTSRHLVIPISEHQDTVGPMARTVKDAAYILAAIAGPDPKDNYTSAIPFDEIPDYPSACDGLGLEGARIGVPRNIINIDDSDEVYRPVLAAFNASLDVLRQAGATVVDDIHLEGYETLARANWEGVVLDVDFVANLADYYAGLESNPRNITNLAETQAFTQEFPLEEFPSRDTAIWERGLGRGFGQESPEFWSNYTSNLYYGGLLGITGAIRNLSLDALVVPTIVASHLPAVIGSPIVTIPLGAFPENTPVIPNSRGNLNDTAPNIPFGFAFLGDYFSEEKLIGLAYDLEQRTLVRNTIKPYIEPTTEIADISEL